MPPRTMSCRCLATASTVTRSTSSGKSSPRYAITERIEVSPLSPARQCASSCSLGIARPLLQGDLRGDSLAFEQSRDDADLFPYVLARAAARRGPVGVERFDFLADDHRPLRGRRACSHAQANFVG